MLFFVDFQEVGMPADYLNRLARMFQDIKVSEDLNNEFKENTRNNNECIADSINIKVCTVLVSMHIDAVKVLNLYCSRMHPAN